MTQTPGNPEFEALASDPLAVRWTMAATGEIVEVSGPIEQVRGISPEVARAQSVDQIHPPESLQASLAYFEQFSRDVLAGRTPAPFHGDLGYFHADGSLVWCEVMAVPRLDVNGVVVALDGVSAPTGLDGPRDQR